MLGITVALGFLERTFHLGIFMPEYGGDPVLFQHFFWFYSHPAVYIMILPAMGIVSEVVAVFSRKPIFGYKFIAMSSIAIALIGFLVWGHHMFVSGQSKWANVIFSFLTLLVAIPSAIKTFNWLATMYKGHIVLKTPMLFVLSFFAIFGVGGLTGLFLGALATDIPLHDTYFVVAHFHFVMVGAVMIAFLAGLFLLVAQDDRPHVRRAAGRLASAILVFVGFNVTFIPQFMAGTLGMPRRYATYAEQFQGLHQVSTVGAVMLAAGLVVALWAFVASPAERRPGRRPTRGVPRRSSGRRRRHRPRQLRVAPRWRLPLRLHLVRRESAEAGRCRSPRARQTRYNATVHAAPAREARSTVSSAYHFTSTAAQFADRQARDLALPGSEILFFGALFVAYGVYRGQPPRPLPLRPLLPRLAHGRAEHRGAHRVEPVGGLVGALRAAGPPPGAACARSLITLLLRGRVPGRQVLRVQPQAPQRDRLGSRPASPPRRSWRASRRRSRRAGAEGPGDLLQHLLPHDRPARDPRAHRHGAVRLAHRARPRRGDFVPGYYVPVDSVALYWHLVDIIWIFLFPLLYLI